MNKKMLCALYGFGVVFCLFAGFVVVLQGQESAGPPASSGARRLTLPEAVALALQNNREIQMAEAGVDRAAAEYQGARAVFRPQVYVGTGLAATRGFPLSIEGSAPSIFQVSSSQAFFNPSLRNSERQAGRMEAAAGNSLEEKRDDVVVATILTYLDLDRSRRALEYARSRTRSFLAAEQIVQEQVRAGVAVPLEETRSRLHTARSRSEQVALENQAALLEFRLRDLAGIPQSEAIVTEPAEVPPGRPEESVDQLVSLALEKNPGLDALEEEVRAKQFQVRSAEATRWPRINLVGQYGMFSDINNFSQFFRKFARHNATLGLSIQVPLYDRDRRSAEVSKAAAELAAARYRLEQARANIHRQVRELWGEVEQQAAAREVARLELEVARRSVDAMLARLEEGRASQLDVEQARIEENQGWVNWFQAQYQAEAARLELLRITGEIRSVFR